MGRPHREGKKRGMAGQELRGEKASTKKEWSRVRPGEVSN